MTSDDDALRDSDKTASGHPEPTTPSASGAELPALPDDTSAAPSGPDAYDQVRHTRSASLWSGLILGAVVLLVLLIFILQNLEAQKINLLFWTVNLPVGVSLLIAAILGALVVGLAGGLRIFQLRRAAKKLR
ncbi:LapA family protein [Tsukamurella sp. 8F]|uniref:LapA family protein n=1 Tax=unclassified Tsukamurella TaxID=2633480 RepID=UPI0023B8EB2F|nr:MULTISPECIES: LapA family protein [unclassified Tsukamurella]MDF0531573.1 LapA family protein [Tsukamurella sp. 8J]MDF0587580.1 LapA family protein [Tsukamurella sp. 8F]